MSGVDRGDKLAAVRAVERELGAFDRRPFREVLAELIQAKPTVEQIKAFAVRYPDKWAQAVTMFAGLAGYEKGMVTLNVYNVAQLSDVALLQEIAKGEEGMAKLGLRRAPVTIEGEKRGDAPRPAAEVERDAAGDIVDPAGAV